MNNQVDEKYWLKKISDCRFFTSEKDVELLQYLIQSTNEGKNLKETVIAIEFFDRDASFSPGSDSIVRSNIYNLRKKLESYYLDDGAHDKVKFIIPKGAYKVKVEVAEEEQFNEKEIEPTPKKPALLKWLFLLSNVLMLVFAILYFSNGQIKSASDTVSPIWAYYANSDNSLLIVLGDYFMMQRTDIPDSRLSFIRSTNINNQTDFLDYLENNPKERKNLKKLGQSYFGEEIPKCLVQIQNNLKNRKKPVKIKYSSELSLADIRENDLIFIGDYGTLNILVPFFKKTGYHFSNSPQSIFNINERGDSVKYFSLDNPNYSVFQNDYAIVASVSSYSGKRILFLTSFFPFGKSEALYKIQEPAFISELSDSISSFPSDWELVLKISGLQSSGFYYEVVNFSY